MSPSDKQLNPEEIELRDWVAARRNSRASKFSRKHKWGWDGEHVVEYERQSTGAEIVVAKNLDRYWSDDARTDHDGDIGNGVQVRWTQYPFGHLLAHPEDEDDHIFVLVTGFDIYTIVGWMRGVDCKIEHYWRQDDRPCFWIPQEDVEPWTPGLRELGSRVDTLELQIELLSHKLLERMGTGAR